VLADAEFLCGKAAVFGDKIKDILYMHNRLVARNFSLLHCVERESGDHPVSYLMGKWWLFLRRVKVLGNERTTYRHLVPI
jgi:hypothetical protein